MSDYTCGDLVVMEVPRSNGEVVCVEHMHTNFTRQIVLFRVPSQHAVFVFKRRSITGVYPIERRPIDKDQPADLKISQSLYNRNDWGMAPWASHIFQTGRVELPPKPSEAS